MKIILTALALCTTLGAASALAANARHPYSNIDRRTDSGNDTGDSRVEQLNQMQLDQARAGTNTAPVPATGMPTASQPMMVRPMMVQPMTGEPSMSH